MNNHRQRSQFSWEGILMGFILGIGIVIDNNSAYTQFYGDTILHPRIVDTAGIVLALIGIFSRKITRNRFGILTTSFLGGTALGVIAVGTYYHIGFGLVSLAVAFSAYIMRKEFEDYRGRNRPTVL